MNSHLQFITTPTADTTGTLMLLYFDERRYLIGQVGEGSQRAIIENSVRLGKVSDVFLTGTTSYANTGGLIGTLLTLAENGSRNLTDILENTRHKGVTAEMLARGSELCIHGGPNIKYFLACARRFIFRKKMVTNVLETISRESYTDKEEAPTWKDKNIKVWKMLIDPSDESSQDGRRQSLSRKRTISDVENGDANAESVVGCQTESERTGAGNEDALDEIINFMFNSTWSKSHYVEAMLKDVDLAVPIFARNTDTGEVEKIHRPIDPALNNSEIRVLVRTPWPASLKEELPSTQPSAVALSYIVFTHPRRGKFLPQRAKELGIKPGPDFAALAKGLNVTSSNGNVITPSMVLEPERAGTGFAVFDLPSIQYVEALFSRKELRSQKLMGELKTIIWILGRGVIENDRLQAFMTEKSGISHVISSSEYCSNYLAFQSSATNLIQLGRIDPQRYPIPVHNNVPEYQTRTLSHASISPSSKLFQAERGLRIRIEPHHDVAADSCIPYLNTASVLEKTPKSALSLGASAAQDISKLQVLKDNPDASRNAQDLLPSSDSEIITLGTGSAQPSKYRNVSATLLNMPGKGFYLFDCGEGTYGQLQRSFRPKDLEFFFRNLRMIWVSHLHADHHLGIYSILKAWNDARSSQPNSQHSQPLSVVAHVRLLDGLREYSNLEDIGFDSIKAVVAAPYMKGEDEEQKFTWYNRGGEAGASDDLKQYQEILDMIGVSQLQAAVVPHCFGSMGIALTFQNGFKFSYSGDTRPSKKFVDIGKGSTVLVHEATFDDDLSEDARKKRHSTISEALGVGAAMGAKRMILTHFSQRYPKFPNLNTVSGRPIFLADEAVVDEEIPLLADHDPPEIAELSQPENARHLDTSQAKILLDEQVKSKMKVAVAFDLMRVKVGDIEHMEKFGPALTELLKDRDS